MFSGDDGLIDSLLFDIYVTAPLVALWSDLGRYENSSRLAELHDYVRVGHEFFF